MRLKKSKIRKYEGGGFASATGIGMEMPSPVQEIELEEKDKAARFGNVAKTTAKGAALGAAVGSAVPVIGTAVGAVAGAVGGAALGLITNRKEEKKRQELNKEREAANLEMRNTQLGNWRKYAKMEDSYNIQRAEDTGYDVMGNTDVQFKRGGRLTKYLGGGKAFNEYKNGGLSRSEDFGSSEKPYPSVASGDFAGGNRSYPIPTKADAIDALRLAGLHGRSDVAAKVHAKYPGLGKDKYPDGGKIETKKDVVLPKAFETPIPTELPLVKPEPKKPEAKKAPQKVYSTVKVGDKNINLSQDEHNYLKQFGDDSASRNAALWEMMGVDDYRNTYHPGSESSNKKEDFKNKAIDLFNEGYKVDRKATAPVTYASYSTANTGRAIDNKTTLNTKTENYLGGTSSELSEKAVNEAARKSVEAGGGTYTGSDFDPTSTQKLIGEPGYVPPTEEVLATPAVGLRKGGNVYLKGGRLDQLSNDTYKAVGNSHEQGGIRLTPNAEIEGQETVTNKGDHIFVASATLRNPATGNTFAKDDASLANKIGKFENREDKFSQNALKMLQAKKTNLETIQQSMNGDKTGTSMRSGGRLSIIKAPDGIELYGMQTTGGSSTGLDTAGGGGESLNLEGYTGGVDMQTGQAKTMKGTGTINPSFSGGGGGAAASIMSGSLPGLINTAGQAIANYGTAALEYANQKKQIKKLEALKIPDPILSSYQNLGRQSMDVDKATVNRDVAAANVGADRGLTDSNVAAAVKAANLSKGLQAKAAINQQERNVNQQIANQESQINAQTQAGNNAMLMAKQQAEFQKKADVIGMKSEAFSKLMENIRTGQNTARQEKHVNTQYALDAYKLTDEQRAGLNKYMQQNNNKLYSGKSFKKGGRLSKMYC